MHTEIEFFKRPYGYISPPLSSIKRNARPFNFENDNEDEADDNVVYGQRSIAITCE